MHQQIYHELQVMLAFTWTSNWTVPLPEIFLKKATQYLPSMYTSVNGSIVVYSLPTRTLPDHLAPKLRLYLSRPLSRSLLRSSPLRSHVIWRHALYTPDSSTTPYHIFLLILVRDFPADLLSISVFSFSSVAFGFMWSDILEASALLFFH